MNHIGANYEVEEHADGTATVRVWRRPDLSRDEGARCAEEIVGHMQRLAPRTRGCLFDLTDATTVWGPATHASIAQMLGAWEAAQRPILIVPAEEAIQRITLRELLRGAAPRHGKLMPSRAAAIAALRKLGRPAG